MWTFLVCWFGGLLAVAFGLFGVGKMEERKYARLEAENKERLRAHLADPWAELRNEIANLPEYHGVEA